MRLVRGVWRDVVAGSLVAACLVPFGFCFVVGGSMRPALERGDLVVYRRGGDDAGDGSIVVLEGGGGSYVHRVTGVTAEGRLLTRGDANPIPDREPVDRRKVRGRVVVSVPSGRLVGRLVSWGRSVRLWSQSHTQR